MVYSFFWFFRSAGPGALLGEKGHAAIVYSDYDAMAGTTALARVLLCVQLGPADGYLLQKYELVAHDWRAEMVFLVAK